MALSWTMDKIGPLARSAEDCRAIVLQAIAGPDSPRSIDGSRAVSSFTPGAGGREANASAPCASASCRTNYTKATEAHRLFDAALDLFGKRNLAFANTKYPPGSHTTAAAGGRSVTAEGSAAFREPDTKRELALLADTTQQAGLIAGLAVPACDYLRALRDPDGGRSGAQPRNVARLRRPAIEPPPTLLTGPPPMERRLPQS